METATLISGLITGALIGGPASVLLAWGIWKSNDAGKRNLIMLPSVPGAKAEFLRKRLRHGEFKHRIAKKEYEQIKVSDLAVYPSNRGPIHVVSRETGLNLLAPPRGERIHGQTEQDYKRMVIADPLLYYQAIKENDTQDMLNAKAGKKHWMEALAPMLLLGLLIVCLLFGGIMWLAKDKLFGVH